MVLGKDAVSQPCIVAYVSSDTPDITDQIYQHLKLNLPPYMLPHIVNLSSLPLLSNGKVNRKELAERTIEATIETPGGNYADPFEQVVEDIWKQVLGNFFGSFLDANFFDVGGTSILAAQVVSRLRIVAKVEISIREVFENPTVPELARVVRKIKEDLRKDDIQAINPLHSSNGPLSLSQRRLWILHKLQPLNTSYHIVEAMIFQGSLNITSIEKAVACLVTRHPPLRTIYVDQNEDVFQLVCEIQFPDRLTQFRGTSPLHNKHVLPWTSIFSHHLHNGDPMRATDLAIQLAQSISDVPIDLSTDAVAQFTVHSIDTQHHILIVKIHHMASDGWSSKILWDELSCEYNRLQESVTSTKSPHTVEYIDYATWQEAWIKSSKMENQLDYWNHVLMDNTGNHNFLRLF